MIEHHENIYEAYRRADFNDRLSIYLQFPALRNDFLEIDQQEIRDRSVPGAAGQAPGRARRLAFNPFCRWFKACKAASG